MSAKKAVGFGEDVRETGNPVFGIDLGTTNSAISVVRAGTKPETICLTNGKMTMPSCVEFSNGEIIVGEKAYEDRAHRPEAVVYSVKKLMQTPDAIVTIKDGDNVYKKTPAEISAEILKGLCAQTGGKYGKIEDVVVTVPAYFDQNGINATKKACELAGLNLVSIANEPTAASLCYDLKDVDVQDILVFDLGGGTFDTTLMRVAKDDGDDIYGFSDGSSRSVVTLGIRGDMNLGGDDIDDELVKIIMEKLRKEGIDIDDLTNEYRESLKLRVEKLKKLSTEDTYSMVIDTVGKSGNEIKAELFVMPEDFEAATDVIYRKALKLSKKVLLEHENECSKVVLVGGSTKNPIIRRRIQEDFPTLEVDFSYSPDLSVAEGAAIQGKVYKYGDSDVQIFDILPLGIGVALENGAVSTVIEGDTPLPTSSQKSFSTARDGQTLLGVELYQGNSSYVNECVPLGQLILEVPGTRMVDGKEEPIPAGQGVVNVIISISADRIMKCYAESMGVRKEIELDLSGDLGTADTSSLTKDINRFSKAFDFLNDEDKKGLEELIEKYKVGEVSKADVKDFIKVHRNGQRQNK